MRTTVQAGSEAVGQLPPEREPIAPQHTRGIPAPLLTSRAAAWSDLVVFPHGARAHYVSAPVAGAASTSPMCSSNAASPLASDLLGPRSFWRSRGTW